MVVTMEMDLSDPLSSSMSVDPLHIYSVTSSSSDEQDSPHRPSIQITRIGSNGNTNSAVLSVHKIPSYGNIQSNNGYSHNRMALSEPPKKRGRKKGSKNKFKRGIPIELWNKFASSGMIISKSENPLSLPYQSQPEVSEEVRVKRKYTKRPKIDIDIINEKLQDQIELADSREDNIILELDPACFYPDEPMNNWKQHRRKRLEKWRNMPMHCEICYKGFKHVKGLQIHKASKHGVEDLSGAYPCECCEQVFWMKRELREHLMIHRDPSGRLPCPENCGATEPESAGLVRHKQKYHPYLGTLGRNWFHTWGDR